MQSGKESERQRIKRRGEKPYSMRCNWKKIFMWNQHALEMLRLLLSWTCPYVSRMHRPLAVKPHMALSLFCMWNMKIQRMNKAQPLDLQQKQQFGLYGILIIFNAIESFWCDAAIWMPLICDNVHCSLCST